MQAGGTMHNNYTLSKEEWTTIENSLLWPLAQRKLLCDGYEVTLQVRNLKKLQLAIFVFVNGYMKEKWMLEDCEERRRFLRPMKRPIFRSKDSQKLEQRLAKLQDRPSRHKETITGYYGWWTDFTAMRRHFCRHNQDIRLIKEVV